MSLQHIPPIKEEHVTFLKGHGVEVTPIEPFGARFRGFDLRAAGVSKPPDEVLHTMEKIMADRGYGVFAGQGVLSGDEQVRASCLWGARQMHSTHGVHPKAPNRHIFRLSNDGDVGIKGVGPQWHNDGSFEEAVFSHVGYHIVKVPENGGDTQFAHQGAAFDALPPEKQRLWSRCVSVNATSGVLHPMVHEHPISGRKSVYLHLGMTGGIMEKVEDGFRLMEEDELRVVFNDYNDLMNAGFQEKGGNYAISYPYEEGDCIFIDNLAICHRASEEAHAPTSRQGLRILHRTTIKAPKDFEPGFGLPLTVTRDILRDADAKSGGRGVFQPGGLGFRWDDSIKMQN
jgi:taurine dioxygenase